jgi:hypothetical protein
VHFAHGPFDSCDVLGLGDDLLAQAGALECGIDGEHPGLGSVTVVFELAAGDRVAVALDGDQSAAGCGDHRTAGGVHRWLSLLIGCAAVACQT